MGPCPTADVNGIQKRHVAHDPQPASIGHITPIKPGTAADTINTTAKNHGVVFVNLYIALEGIVSHVEAGVGCGTPEALVRSTDKVIQGENEVYNIPLALHELSIDV